MGKMAKRRDSFRVAGALLLVQLFFGLHYLAAKLVLQEIPPRAWALLRAGSAAFLLLGLARLRHVSLPRARGDLVRLAFYAILGVGINQVCFVEGLHRTSPSHSSVIMTVIPVATLLFAVLLRQESFSGAKGWALGLSLAGALLVIRPEGEGLTRSTPVGDLLTLLNALSYSLFLVVSRRLLRRVDPLAATAVLMAFGTGWIALVGSADLARLDPGAISPATWALAAFIVVFPTAAAYLLNYWALARVESSLVALFIYLQPVIATGLSVLLLGERPGIHLFAGAALIFGGVYLALRGESAGSSASRASSSAPSGNTSSSISKSGE